MNAGADVNETNESLGSSENNNNNNGGSPSSPAFDECLRGGMGATPLMLACAFDQSGFVVRELILNARADSSPLDANGFHTLHYAAIHGNRNVFEIVRKYVLLCFF